MKNFMKGVSVLLSVVMIITSLCFTTVKADTEKGQAEVNLLNGEVTSSSDTTRGTEVTEQPNEDTENIEIPETISTKYMKALGNGWNLGNTFDSFDTNLNVEDLRENTWGNPNVTKELIHAIKQEGFDSIRIPMTTYRRCSKVNGKYVIDETWLARYKEVVDWAVDEGFYVMINMHHDSSWLSNWDGNVNSDEYIRYTQCWEQIADYFKDEPEQVCFETINEPQFNYPTKENTIYDMLDAINMASYKIIRKSGGNNATRMIVLPTYNTNQNAESLTDLYEFIKGLHDENVIATIHYYSEWCFSGNLGTTGFDDPVNGGETTSRDAIVSTFKTVYDKFIANGIGIVVGEYGLLGTNEVGEYVKYIESVNAVGHQYGMSMMFWDAGNYINRRDTENYSWNEPRLGEMVDASMKGRSSTAACLDELYFQAETEEDIEIPLRINGPKFVGIKGLTEGKDFTYDETKAIITLKAAYVNAKFATLGEKEYGVFDELLIQFTSGADWHEYLCKNSVATAGKANGSTSGITIPVTYNGAKVRRVSAYQRNGNVGPTHTWCKYLTFASDFTPDYKENKLTLNASFLNDSSITDAPVLVNVEMWDGQVLQIWMNKNGSTFDCDSKYAENTSAEIKNPEKMVIYVGENEIPSQYLNLPEGGTVYGTWITDSNVIKMDGWPATMTFGTTPTDFTMGGIVVYYYDIVQYVNAQFAIKAKPEVQGIALNVLETSKVQVSNLVDDAKVDYVVEDTSIASVENGVVTGLKAGSTIITATVEQYGRKDEFKATVTVSGSIATSEEPVISETPVTSEEPLGSETPVTSEAPVVSETPVASAVPGIPDISVNTEVSGQVRQSFTIKNGSVKDFDLSKLVIRFYYSKDDNKEQNFWIDNAGIIFNGAPYYVNYTSNVKCKVTDQYVELSFAEEQILADGTLTIQTRMNNSDWSSYVNFNAVGWKAYYEGHLVCVE